MLQGLMLHYDEDESELQSILQHRPGDSVAIVAWIFLRVKRE